MTDLTVSGAQILTPEGWLDGFRLVIRGGRIAQIEPDIGKTDMPGRRFDGGMLVPGFVDIQVNGGGGILFNDQPSIEGIAAIGTAHRQYGTTGFLPTLISDELHVVASAIAATEAAIEARIPGVLGLHVEGPFINHDRSGIHDPKKFRTLDDDAISLLASLRNGVTLVTLAPELAPPGAIATLTARGVIVVAGHSEADYETMARAHAEGMVGVTHLYNAMSQLNARAPGVVGATLDLGLFAGVIVDGHHVHAAALRVAHRALGIDRMMLVTDAMPTVGWNRTQFHIGGREISLRDGMLTSDSGTLAGSHLDMASAVRNAIDMLDVPLADACRMASTTPCTLLELAHQRGTLEVGNIADIVHMNEALAVTTTWIGGQAI